MTPGKAYSVPIPPDSGVVIRPYDEYPPTDTPPQKRFDSDHTDRAIVVGIGNRIHAYPIGPENPAYYNPAPTR